MSDILFTGELDDGNAYIDVYKSCCVFNDNVNEESWELTWAEIYKLTK